MIGVVNIIFVLHNMKISGEKKKLKRLKIYSEYIHTNVHIKNTKLNLPLEKLQFRNKYIVSREKNQANGKNKSNESNCRSEVLPMFMDTFISFLI